MTSCSGRSTGGQLRAHPLEHLGLDAQHDDVRAFYGLRFDSDGADAVRPGKVLPPFRARVAGDDRAPASTSRCLEQAR